MSDRFPNRPPAGGAPQEEAPQYERGIEVFPPWTAVRFRADIMPSDREKLEEVTGIDLGKEYLVLGILSPDEDEGPQYLLGPADMPEDEARSFKMEEYLTSGEDRYYQVPINFVERALKQ